MFESPITENPSAAIASATFDRRLWQPPLWCWPMINGYHHGCRPQALGTGSTAEIHRVPEIVKHVAFALSHHVRRLHREALPVPGEVEELAHFLKHLARIRQGSSTLADEVATAQYAFMPDRLLVTKGEAAQRLCVSVRTIERLVATGRLRSGRTAR